MGLSQSPSDSLYPHMSHLSLVSNHLPRFLDSGKNNYTFFYLIHQNNFPLRAVGTRQKEYGCAVRCISIRIMAMPCSVTHKHGKGDSMFP